jgi:hypothetical protein
MRGSPPIRFAMPKMNISTASEEKLIISRKYDQNETIYVSVKIVLAMDEANKWMEEESN